MRGAPSEEVKPELIPDDEEKRKRIKKRQREQQVQRPRGRTELSLLEAGTEEIRKSRRGSWRGSWMALAPSSLWLLLFSPFPSPTSL